MMYRLFYVALIALGCAACCNEELIFQDEVEVTVLEIVPGESYLPGSVADTLRGPFQYRAIGIYHGYATAVPTVRPGQLLMGFSCDEQYDRAFDAETVSLSLDHPISLRGVTVLAGENLLPSLEQFSFQDIQVYTSSTGLEIIFLEGFFASADIAPGDYTFTLAGMLDDGTLISETTQVYLDF
ncbi:hypothetical protein CLV84_2461 [Neolewinella xylanilytica]|uniref:Uncharacterized protein n=1 Tax=Neolewinella xylanilytica TaxID=1514080 RepID=A0A2S6I329_9BACT|nr:hypothetical protein [Neolewinella xylanilytica]PPK85560.1 hypothetical protein CLV84_2461 [Neolewinella xylanilytica]